MPWDMKKALTFDTLRKKTTVYSKVSTKPNPRKTWTPPALRPLTLGFIILVSLGLLVTLQLFLIRSNRDQGVIFAPSISELPLSRTFMYQYFPTILAVVYSIFWAWIDLETKRVEPWYRLSRDGGSAGHDSLLLSYPSDFAPFVPIRAFQRRHWPVFWASFALLLVTWGLVPVQAGIFSIHRVNRETVTMFNVSKGFMPADRQPQELNLKYQQSAYGIASLNETLPPYMGINGTNFFTLAPFTSSVNTTEFGEVTYEWTAPTTMYNSGIRCEPTYLKSDTYGTYESSWGCNFTVGLDGNQTQSVDNPSMDKGTLKYSALYANAYKDLETTYHIDYCPPDRSHTFYAALQENKRRDSDPPNNVTAIFCEPVYYVQDVNATINSKSKRPIRITPLGSQRELTEHIFNITAFEKQMAYGNSLFPNRGDFFPARDAPMYYAQITDKQLSSGAGSTNLVGLVVTMGNVPLQDYLDWLTMAKAYANTHRLLFALAMTEVLADGVSELKQAEGKEFVSIEAVVLEPVFTYIVEGFLAAVTTSALFLLYLSQTRAAMIVSDPSTMASIMSLVANNEAFLADFKDLDCCVESELKAAVREKKYKICEDSGHISIADGNGVFDSSRVPQRRQQTVPSKEIENPVRPTWFRLWMAVLLIGVFVILATALIVVFIQALSNGLPLPSKNKLVQNILENYIPTAIVMFIEPVWILINRYLCLLQPMEELWKGNAKAKTSIDVNYSSLPPQLVIWKSLKARHVVLTAVCGMSLLSNLLAVAFAGLFHHKTTEVRILESFQPPFDATFVSINGTAGPSGRSRLGTEHFSGAYRGGDGHDHFLIAESNYTRGTPLPAWTDDTLFYLPFKSSSASNFQEQLGGAQYEAEATAFGAELVCSILEKDSIRILNRTQELGDVTEIRLMITLSAGDTKVDCMSDTRFNIDPSPENAAVNGQDDGCQTGSSAAELVFTLEPVHGVNASQTQRNICQSTGMVGWLRRPEGSCGITPAEAIADNASLFQCKPQLVRGRGTVRVDETGRLLRPVTDRLVERDFSLDDVKANFSNDPVNLLSQANRYIFHSWRNPWHSDAVASDFLNYFVRLSDNSTRLVDPKTSVPTLEDVQIPLNRTYAKLFAIWLGANSHKLLKDGTGTAATAWQIEPKERLFMSTPLFGISLGILLAFAIVAMVVYARRPGQFLPRLPTSVASTIGLFAASSGVRDMRGTSLYNAKERAQHLKALGARYGYGNYVGVDGNIHVGIEKAPYVQLRTSEKKVFSFRKRHGIDSKTTA